VRGFRLRAPRPATQQRHAHTSHMAWRTSCGDVLYASGWATAAEASGPGSGLAEDALIRIAMKEVGAGATPTGIAQSSPSSSSSPSHRASPAWRPAGPYRRPPSRAEQQREAHRTPPALSSSSPSRSSVGSPSPPRYRSSPVCSGSTSAAQLSPGTHRIPPPRSTTARASARPVSCSTSGGADPRHRMDSTSSCASQANSSRGAFLQTSASAPQLLRASQHRQTRPAPTAPQSPPSHE
jgi:hypothetical protein